MFSRPFYAALTSMMKKPTYTDLRNQVSGLENEILARDATEKRIRHLNRVLTAIRNVNRLIIKEKSRKRLSKGVCDILIEDRGYHNAWIMIFKAPEDVLCSAEAGLGDAFSDILENIRRGRPPNCYHHARRTGRLLAVQDPAAACADCPLSHMYRGRSALSCRLEYDNKTYGLLTVSIPSIFCEDEEERRLFRGVTRDIAFALHSIDIEERRRRAEEELHQARADLERRVRERTRDLEIISSKLLNAHEEERKRIACDLHDSIGQTLSAAKFMVETALENMGEPPDGRIRNLAPLAPMLGKAAEEVRRIVMNLRPSILDDLGVVATIGWFCRQFRSVYADIRVEEDIAILENQVPESLKIIIFRVLQEAMNNAAKHSRADRITLRLHKTANKVMLTVADNGDGFDVEAFQSRSMSERGFGVAGMKERTELSGGVFDIVSAPGGGATVKACWEDERIRVL